VTGEQQGEQNCDLLYRRHVSVDFDVAVGDDVGVDGVKRSTAMLVLQIGRPKLKVELPYKLVLMEIGE
jgi:hypothetical protein